MAKSVSEFVMCDDIDRLENRGNINLAVEHSEMAVWNWDANILYEVREF